MKIFLTQIQSIFGNYNFKTKTVFIFFIENPFSLIICENDFFALKLLSVIWIGVVNHENNDVILHRVSC